MTIKPQIPLQISSEKSVKCTTFESVRSDRATSLKKASPGMLSLGQLLAVQGSIQPAGILYIFFLTCLGSMMMADDAGFLATFHRRQAVSAVDIMSAGRIRAKPMPKWRILPCAKLPNLFAASLRGGGVESDEEASWIMEEEVYEDPAWEGLTTVPGFEDAMPHPDVTGWDAEEYTRRGIDMSGGILNPTEEEMQEHAIEDGTFNGEELAKWDESAEEEKAERELKGVCPMCPAHMQPGYVEPPRPDYVNMPVSEMAYEDWEEITQDELRKRIKKSYQAFCENRSSPLFESAYVYGNATQGEDRSERLERLVYSFMGMHETLPAIERFMDTCKANALSEKEDALIKAALDGDAQQCAFWVRRGANINVVDDSMFMSYSPLHHAAHVGHASTCARLLELGADPHAQEAEEGRTPLHLAAVFGWCDVVKALVKGGSPVDIRSGRRGRTPLHDAAGNGQTHTCMTLLSLGASPTATYMGLPEKMREPAWSNAHGTALHDAAEGGFTETCLVLLRAGASLHATDADGLTARDRADARATEGDPHCPLDKVIGVLEAWDNGTIGPDDPLPTRPDEGGMGIRGRVHPAAGREVRGDGGDVVGFEAPMNYNGVPPPARTDRFENDFDEDGAYFIERDYKTMLNAYAGVRRPGFVNPGHTLNYGQDRMHKGGIVQALLPAFLIANRRGPPEEFRRERAYLQAHDKLRKERYGENCDDEEDELDERARKNLGFWQAEVGRRLGMAGN